MNQTFFKEQRHVLPFGSITQTEFPIVVFDIVISKSQWAKSGRKKYKIGKPKCTLKFRRIHTSIHIEV